MLQLRQRVAIDIAKINMTLKQLLYWMELKPEQYVPVLDSQLAHLGEWADEVHTFLCNDKNPMVFHLAMHIYPLPQLPEYLYIYERQMNRKVASSIKVYLDTIPKIKHLYAANRQQLIGKRLSYLVGNLACEKAADLLQRAVDADLLDSRFQPLEETTRGQQKTIAFAVSQLMGFPERGRWVDFNNLWPYKDGNLSTRQLPVNNREIIDKVMALYPEADFSDLLQKSYDNVHFSCKITKESVEFLYFALKNGEYISKKTTFSQFYSIFVAQRHRKPVEWLSTQNLLGCLVHLAFNKPYEPIWRITCECFTVRGKRPNCAGLRSNVAKVIREERISDKRLLEIIEKFRNLSQKEETGYTN